MEEFALKNTEFIELNNLLKVLGLCDTGGIAKATIAEGRVKVNGEVELRKRCKIRKGDVIDFEGYHITVR
jgi:ribosome-associated protein